MFCQKPQKIEIFLLRYQNMNFFQFFFNIDLLDSEEFFQRNLTFSNLLVEIFIIFQAMYCKDLPFDCPTKADFDFFDADGNGILTWSEWKSLHE